MIMLIPYISLVDLVLVRDLTLTYILTCVEYVLLIMSLCVAVVCVCVSFNLFCITQYVVLGG